MLPDRHTCQLILFIFFITGALQSFASTDIEDYQSGFRRSSILDPMGGVMQYSVWYPTKSHEALLDIGPFQLPVAKDASLAEGKFGLIILSHGTGGSDLGHRDIARTLARHGFIAVAALHPRDNFRDRSALGHRIVWEGRPRQVIALIDHFLSTTPWANKIDPNRIGVFGFSLGGYTMLSVLGGEHDPRVLVRHCTVNHNDPLCNNFGELTKKMREIAEVEYQTPVESFADSRIRAAVLVDPMTGVFEDDTLATLLDVPISIYMPEVENELLGALHGERIARVLSKTNRDYPADMKVISGAHHFSFISPFPASIALEIPHIANDNPGFNRTAFHQQFSTEVAHFFLRYLPEIGYD